MPLYPLKGIPKQRQIWSWISFDVANQSFTLLINTLLFSIFFQEVVVRDKNTENTWWSAIFATSMLLVVIASPVAGAVADGKNWKKLCLLSSGFSCAVLTCTLGLIGPNQKWLAAAIYIPANFMFNIGENFLASFLPSLAKREDYGRVSGFSWGVAYFSALLMLVATALVMKWFNITSPEQWRPFFVAAGLWFAAFAVPTLLFLKENPTDDASTTQTTTDQGNPLLVGFHRLATTLRELPKFRDLATLLLASLFYGAGMSVVVSFASILAKNFGFESQQMVIFVAVITVSGIFGTLFPTLFQDRVGHKRMTLILLLLWVATTIYLAIIAHGHTNGSMTSKTPVWIAGNMLGIGLGSLGSANRAFVGYLTPPSRSAEFFGLWGLVFKLAAVLVVPFGYVKDKNLPASLIVLAGFVVIGFILTLFINEKRGAAAAAEQIQPSPIPNVPTSQPLETKSSAVERIATTSTRTEERSLFIGFFVKYRKWRK